MKVIDKEDNVIEIVLNEEKIEKLESQLKELKSTKGHIHLNDGEESVLIHHEEGDSLK